MGQDKTCPQCGRAIPSDAPGGVCPVCLLSQATGASERAPWTAASRDQNLLFALFAHLLKYIDTDAFAEAIREWIENPSVAIADLMVERDAISKASRDYLDGLIAHALEFYQGNVSRALESLGGHDRVANIMKSASDSSARELIRTRLALNVSETLLDSVPAPEVTVSERPGRYTGSSEYSRGGMGRILLVHDELLARDIALKELLPPSDVYVGTEDSPVRQSAALLARFLREARITGRLEHPSIVPVYELGRRANGSLYYTMRLVRGKTLRTVLQECKSLEERLRLLPNFVDLCMGIAYAHSKGVVHRDIKPSNVMIGEFGETVIIDWGLAKVVDKTEIGHPSIEDTLHKLHGSAAVGPDKTITGEVLGSPHYMSPEQAAGKVNEIDARSDVFSLGSLLYEILADHAAFDESSLDALIEQIQHEEPEPIEKREPHVPKELASICYRAIQKEKARRYSSAKEMGDDVNRFLSGSIVSAYNYSLWERAWRFYLARRSVLTTTAVAILAVVVTGVTAFINVSRSRDAAISARQQVQADRYLTKIRLAQSFLDLNDSGQAAEVLWSAESQLRNWEWGYLLNRSYPEVLRIEDYPVAALFPDETRVVAASMSSPMQIFAVPNGEALREFPDTANMIGNMVAVSPDGRRVLAGCRDTTLRLWDAETGIESRLKGHRNDVLIAGFMPGGERAYSSDVDGVVHVWDLRTLTSTGEIQTNRRSTPSALPSPDGRNLAIWLQEPGAEIQVWDIESNPPIKRWARSGTRPAFVPNSKNILCLDQDEIVEVDVEDGHEIRRLTEHQAQVTRVAVSGDGSRAISGATDGVVILWDLTAHKMLMRLEHGRSVSHLAMSSNGKTCAAGSITGPIHVWNGEDGKPLAVLPGHIRTLSRMEFGSSGEILLTTSVGGTARIWNVRKTLGIVQTTTDRTIQGLEAAAEEDIFASTESDNIVVVRSLESLSAVEEFFTAGWIDQSQVAISRDGRRLALLLDGFTTIVWDRIDRRVLGVVGGHEGFASGVGMDSAGTRVAAIGWDGCVEVWSGSAPTGASNCPAGNTPLDSITMSPDGELIIAGANDGSIFVISSRTGEIKQTVKAHGGSVTGLALNARADLLATASADKSAKEWSWPGLTPLGTFTGHAEGLNDVAFYADGARVLTYSFRDDTGRARFWDTTSQEELIKLDVTPPIAVIPTRLGILIASRDRRIQRLEAAPHSPLDDPPTEKKRFDEYIRNFSAKPADVANASSPLPRTIFNSTEWVTKDLASVAAGTPPAQSPPGTAAMEAGWPIPSEADPGALKRLGLHAGDRILRIEGRQIFDAPALRANLEGIIAEVSAGNRSTLSVEVRHEGRYLDFRYQILPVMEREIVKEINRAEAIERMAKIGGVLGIGRRIVEVESIKDAAAMGIASNGSTLAGFFLSRQSGLLERDDYLKFGFGPRDRITHIDEVPLTSADTLIRQWSAATESIRSGTRGQFTLQVERGQFERVRVTVKAT